MNVVITIFKVKALKKKGSKGSKKKKKSGRAIMMVYKANF